MTTEGFTIEVILDENVERQVLSYLRTDGHDGVHVVDVLEPGADDDRDIAPYARENDVIVVTKDTDFLAMDPSKHVGVLFVADHRRSAYEIATAIIDAVDAVPDRESLQGVTYVDSWG